ncbi:MAG: holo-ACP synthase [Lachnospiraceae bacterium]|nr:holo-ACP synthase [Lachnospiraceae bacterium]
MILGIGVDTVDIERIRKMLGEKPQLRRLGEPSPSGSSLPAPEEPPFFRRVFSEAERAAAPQGRARAEYYAARFAAKEAVFKAVAHLLPEKTFDLRLVETLHREDGSPYVVMDGALREVYAAAGVGRIHISVTTEGQFATVFVIAESL